LPYVDVSRASFAHMPTACRRHYDIAPYSMSKSYQQAALLLAGSEWAVSSAEPLSPHIVMFGAITAKSPQPLPSHLESFVGTAGEHGVVLASLGSTAIPGMSHVGSIVFSQLLNYGSAGKTKVHEQICLYVHQAQIVQRQRNDLLERCVSAKSCQ